MEAAAQLKTTPPAAPARKGGAKKILMGIAATVALVVLGIGAYWAYTHPTVHMVNASSTKTLTIFVDDKQVAELSAALTEDEAKLASASTLVAAGEHTFSAKDDAGKVVDTQKVKVEPGKPYLYAPVHSKKVCWTLQTDAYGDVDVDKPLIALDPSQSLWQLERSPDFWFEDTPDSVQTNKNKKGDKKTALRQHECGDAQFAADEE